MRRGSGSAADRAALGAKRFRRVPGPRLPPVGERLCIVMRMAADATEFPPEFPPGACP